MVFYIYKIKNVNYIGSTNNINRRCINHKERCWGKSCKNYHCSVYQYIRKKNIDIELEILFCYNGNCSYKTQRLVEQYYINKYDSKNNGLNSDDAFCNRIKYLKQYRQENKDKMKLYYEKNKGKLINRAKKYYQINKERIEKAKKIRWEKNKEKRKKKINCPICKSLIRKYCLKAHQKTKKCLKIKNSNISQNEIDFKYNQTAYNEEGEFMNWY